MGRVEKIFLPVYKSVVWIFIEWWSVAVKPERSVLLSWWAVWRQWWWTAEYMEQLTKQDGSYTGEYVKGFLFDLKGLQRGPKSKRKFICDLPWNISYIDEYVACTIEMQANMWHHQWWLDWLGGNTWKNQLITGLLECNFYPVSTEYWTTGFNKYSPNISDDGCGLEHKPGKNWKRFTCRSTYENYVFLVVKISFNHNIFVLDCKIV